MQLCVVKPYAHSRVACGKKLARALRALRADLFEKEILWSSDLESHLTFEPRQLVFVGLAVAPHAASSCLFLGRSLLSRLHRRFRP